MKIKKIATEQFAGIRNKEITFGDGINVIFGNNESGKSTIVNLISGILFQNAKINKKTDKNFNDNAFPANRTDGKNPGNNIDGTIEIETSEGDYKLTKEWGEEPTAKLITPIRTVKNYNEIIDELKSVLGCDEGTYKEMLLSPQSAAQNNLEKILNGGSETNKTLSEAVSQAFAESDGVPVDKLGNEIEAAISELTGKCWDIEKGKPVDKYKEKKQSLGEIVTALKKLEKVQDDVTALKELERDFDDALKDFSQKEKSVNIAENKLAEFEKFFDIIRDNSINKAAVTRCEKDLREYYRALDEFPKSQEDLKNAKKLASEKEKRLLLDCYVKSKKAHDELREIESKIQSISRPGDDEIKSLKSAQRAIQNLENKLRGMNIAATLKMLGNNTVKITSLLSGEPIELEGENAVLTEAVCIEIPGVMEMSLAPAKVNIADINAEIANHEKRISEIFGKYNYNSVEEIEQLAANYDKLSYDCKTAENNFKTALGNYDFPELESKAKTLSDIRSMASIDSDISALCKGMDINKFIGARESDIKKFVENYESEEKLKTDILAREDELRKAQDALNSAENIPEKYSGISDPDAYKGNLKTTVESARKARNDASTIRTTAETKLNEFVGDHGDDLQEKLEKANAEYNEKVELLERWQHIQKVFNKHKAALAENPLDSFAANFVSYLAEISDGRITANFAETGMSDFEVASGDYKLDFAKLSDGTKETVYLAFRFAVLEHLFPNGGGVIVLDDPLNDMDIERVERSCKLIQKVSEHHQVIFLTCREEYADKLGGNVIRIA